MIETAEARLGQRPQVGASYTYVATVMTTGADFVRLQLLSGSTVGRLEEASESALMHIIWILVIGLAAGVIARLVTPGKKAPFGFMLTTVLGITGAFAVAYLGQEAGWYRVEETASMAGAMIGAIVVLCIWALLFRSGRPTSSL